MEKYYCYVEREGSRATVRELTYKAEYKEQPLFPGGLQPLRLSGRTLPLAWLNQAPHKLSNETAYHGAGRPKALLPRPQTQ